MWQYAKVEMDFEYRLCGSQPLNKEIVGPWLESRMPKEKPEGGKSIEEIKEEVLASIDGVQDKITLGFQSNDGGLFVRSGTIKSHLKDCANQIKDTFKPEIKAFRSKVANKLFIEKYAVELLKSGKRVIETDGIYDQPVHVMTPQGPRDGLKKIQYIEKPSIVFTMKLLIDKEIKKEHIYQIFEYGTIHGYGGERGMGEGRYKFKIEWQ